MSAREILTEELDAFDPQWKLRYATLFDAATACGCEDLYGQYLSSTSGQHERETIAAPDYAGAAKRAAESSERFEEASQ
jgi:hypothetical protein